MIYASDHFVQNDREQLFRLMRRNSFATFVSTPKGEPVITHVPALVDEKTNSLNRHVARPNSIWRNFGPDHELPFIFQGPHHYIFPGWYTVQPSVPTWNYAVVHVKGRARVIDDQPGTESLVAELVQIHEAQLAPEWAMALPAECMRQIFDGIVACEARITHLQGKFKPSRIRSEGDRLNVIAALQENENPDAARVAALMSEMLES